MQLGRIRIRSRESSLLADLAGLDLSAGRRATISAAGVVLVALLGYLDFITPAVVSLAVLYVLVVVATTLLAGSKAGMITAVASTLAWVVGDSALIESDWTTYLVNGALRLAALLVVVVLVDRLVDALGRARLTSARGREFLATAAHQLRTPIAGMRASVDALSYLEPTPEQEVILTNLVGETARAGRLVNSLLRVARLDQGETMTLAALPVSAIVAPEIERCRAMTPSDIDIVVSVGSDPVVLADADATREALANLLDNARRHAHHRIELRVEVTGRAAGVQVIDDGTGIPPGDAELVFARFRTLDGAGGSGLGLAIARTIARRQDGDLVYEGGRFVMTLPTLDTAGLPDRARHDPTSLSTSG